MGKVSFSGSEKSIEAIWSWYYDQKEAIRSYKFNIINAIITSSSYVNSKFLTLSLDDINIYFEESELELEHLVCFNLISATEAYLRLDFYKKVYNKDKSEIGRVFREIHKSNLNKISLENDIIENWKKVYSERKGDFSSFLGLLKYRHWLAHGRYWKPKHGQNYNPEIIYDVAENIFDIVSI